MASNETRMVVGWYVLLDAKSHGWCQVKDGTDRFFSDVAILVSYTIQLRLGTVKPECNKVWIICYTVGAGLYDHRGSVPRRCSRESICESVNFFKIRKWSGSHDCILQLSNTDRPVTRFHSAKLFTPLLLIGAQSLWRRGIKPIMTSDVWLCLLSRHNVHV